MSTRVAFDRVDGLNIGLMIASAGLAFLYPFQLFLFVYAVLGPAHYLTEISWLHDRKYFAKGRLDPLFLLAATILLTALAFRLIPGVQQWMVAVITFVAFAAALVFATVKSAAARVVLIGLSVAAGVIAAEKAPFLSVFSVFLPTLIHVSLFTGCFILVGALRGRSLSGILALAVFVAVGLGLFLYVPDRAATPVSAYVRDSYGYLRGDGGFTDGFIGLNYNVMTALGLHQFGSTGLSHAEFVDSVNAFLYASPRGLSVMSFIAFAYCYHYLNWFSKTSIIRWHEVPRSRIVLIALIWVASISVYAYDYALGLKWLFLLSLAHVLLELPLNHLTFINIGKELVSVVSGRPPATGGRAVRPNA